MEHLLAKLIYVSSVASVEGQGFRKPVEVNEPEYDTGWQQASGPQRKGGRRVAGQGSRRAPSPSAYSGAIDRMLAVPRPGSGARG